MIQNENTRFTSVTLLGRQDDESVSLPIACRMDSWFHRLARGEKHNEAQRSCICFHESKPIFTVNSQICIDSCQRAMCILLLLSSRLFSCLASECTCAGTLLPWPRRSTISDCLVSTPQSSHEVLIDAKISLYVLVCFIIPSDHASVPYIFLSHETQSKKEIIQVSSRLETLQLFGKVCNFTLKGSHQEVHRYLQRHEGWTWQQLELSTTGKSRTISLLRSSPRSAQMPEAGSWKTTIGPVAK